MQLKKILSLLLLLSVSAGIYAQSPDQPFYNDVMAFKKKDSITAPPANPILFIGSSSFTKWTNVQDAFPGYTILNRAFGGSTLLDLIRYTDQVVFPYNPKQIVIYCGENDVASSDSIDSKIVADRFKVLFTKIRAKLPAVPIVFVSMKPSPVRAKFRNTIVQGNQIIKNYFYTVQGGFYVDVFTKMLDAQGNPRKELFLDDMLHMKPEGYQIWQAAILPYLMKN